MHKKDRGTIGQLAVTKALMQMGYAVFTEVGDNSKVDLIALCDRQPVKIQVKAYKTELAGSVVKIWGRKSGPNYQFTYHENDFAIFAVHVYELDEILYVPLKEVLATRDKTLYIRLTPARNGQNKNIRLADNYRSFVDAVNKQWM